jgi:hypothetical protein
MTTTGVNRVARFTDWFADAAGAIVHRPSTKLDAIELALFAILGFAAVAGIILVAVWMVQRGNWEYLPLLLVFFVVPVAVWHER